MSNNREWPEKELEDAIIARPEILFNAILIPLDGLTLIGRQVRCGTGIIDLLFSGDKQLYLVELKAVTATEEAIGQVTRYRESIMDAVRSGLLHYGTDSQKTNLIYPEVLYIPPVYCFVVAPSFTKQAILSCSHMGYPLIARKTDDGEFILSDAESHGHDEESQNALVERLKDYCINLLVQEEASFDLSPVLKVKL